jgi:GNAT superfamily N-acetyltransferase
MTRATSIRVARPADADAIAALTKQLGYDVTAASVADKLSRMLARSDQQFFVAEHDGRPVGWVHTVIWEYLDADRFVVIGGLVVDAECRKQGIGRQLMARAEEWALSQGCSIVRLWSSAVRTEAHRFYERIGYVNIKTQYSFVKPLEGSGPDALRKFVPHVS